jgi:hypothetical protein
MGMAKEQGDPYFDKIKAFVMKIDKTIISDFDLFQRIFLDVELTRGDKLSEIVAAFKRSKVEVEPEELYSNALEALKKVLPETVFDAYIFILESDEIKNAMGYYKPWLKEFEKLCLMTEKLKKFEGHRN